LLSKSLLLVLPLALLAALSVAPVAGSAPTERASLHAASVTSFSDAPGDSGAAPDVTDVVVGNDVVLGPLVFWVTLGNRPDGLTGDDTLVLFLNTDRNPATGDAGTDYAMAFDAESAGAFHWDGTTYAPIQSSSLNARFFKGTKEVRIEIHPNDLGGTTAFDFFVEGALGDAYDDAPNGPPDWTYTLSSGLLHLAVVSAVTTRPTAGKNLTVGLLVGRDDTGDALTVGKVRCAARVGTRSLRVARSGFTSGIPYCSWKVPKSAKGKLVRATTSVTYGGATAKKSVSLRVR
jgi:hypothetical protein